MNFNEYQTFARSTAIYPNLGDNISYPALGLCGESGEVAEKIKKILRDKGGNFDESDREAVKKELGDVLWYIANLSSEFGILLSDVAQTNKEKLEKRKQENKIHGNGDNR